MQPKVLASCFAVVRLHVQAAGDQRQLLAACTQRRTGLCRAAKSQISFTSYLIIEYPEASSRGIPEP